MRTRRRLRRLVRQRLLDALTGWILVLLSAASVFLAAVVWSGALWSSRPLANGASAAAGRYVATVEDLQILQTDQIAEPERLTFVYPGGNHDYGISDPTSTAYGVVWHAVVGALSGLATAQLTAATDDPLPKVMARLAQLSERSGAASGCGAALEVDLGPALPWRDWLAALTNGTDLAQWHADATLAGMRVDHFVILPPGNPSGGSASLVLFDGAAGTAIPLPLRAYQQLPLCQPQVRNPQASEAYPVVPLTSEGPLTGISQAVPVPAGLLVSAIGEDRYPAPSALANTRWKPVSLHPESLNRPDLLPLVVFADPLAVQTVRSGSEVVYTAPQGRTLVVDAPTGRLALTTLEPPGNLSWYSGLLGALRYVSDVGGWPPGSWLSGSDESPSTCGTACAPPTRATYSFASRFQGLPVFGAAISVTMVGSNGEPEAYERNVTVAGAALPPQHPNPPAAAVAELVHQPPPQLGAAPFQVVSITPAWVPDPTVPRLDPVWAVEVDTDTGGSPVVELVDAETGKDRGSWAASG